MADKIPGGMEMDEIRTIVNLRPDQVNDKITFLLIDGIEKNPPKGFTSDQITSGIERMQSIGGVERKVSPGIIQALIDNGAFPLREPEEPAVSARMEAILDKYGLKRPSRK